MGDLAGVGKCGRGNIGEALSLPRSPANCRNGISGESGVVAQASSSFAFSCWYRIHARTSDSSTARRIAQKAIMASVGSGRFLYNDRSCHR